MQIKSKYAMKELAMVNVME